MAVDERDTSIASLVRGILDDIRDLFREEVALARAEAREEVGKATAAGLRLAAGAGALAGGGLLILLALARLAANLLGWPVWGGYGLLGVLLAVLGGVGVAAARRQFRKIKGPQQTMETMKENKEWIARKASGRT